MNQLLILDTETGGFDSNNHSLLSIGAVVWQDGEIREEIEIFVAEPEFRAEPEALAVSGLNLNWLREHGVAPLRAVAVLEDFLRAHFPGLGRGDQVSLGGHNVDFDAGFLKRLYRLAGSNYRAIYSHRYLDTASVLRFLYLAGKIPLAEGGLEEAIRYFGINVEPGKRHSALADARATGQVLTNLLALVN